LLGELYIRRARETGDVSSHQRAEIAINQALDLLPGYAPAGSLLASIYYAQHEFVRALTLAEELYESNMKNSQARIVMADSYLSLGNYEAEAIYLERGETNMTAPLLARLANLAELKGNPDEALTLIQRAAGDALNSGRHKGERRLVPFARRRYRDVGWARLTFVFLNVLFVFHKPSDCLVSIRRLFGVFRPSSVLNFARARSITRIRERKGISACGHFKWLSSLL
jgi:tetratricopeptide (TPR) repeat protein